MPEQQPDANHQLRIRVERNDGASVVFVAGDRDHDRDY